MEKDPEIKGEGNSYTTEFRQYDPRLGRWMSLDPLMMEFPSMSPYVAFDNNPIFYTDPLGLAPSNDGGGGPPKGSQASAENNQQEEGNFGQDMHGNKYELGSSSSSNIGNNDKDQNKDRGRGMGRTAHSTLDNYVKLVNNQSEWYVNRALDNKKRPDLVYANKNANIGGVFELKPTSYIAKSKPINQVRGYLDKLNEQKPYFVSNYGYGTSIGAAKPFEGNLDLLKPYFKGLDGILVLPSADGKYIFAYFMPNPDDGMIYYYGSKKSKGFDSEKVPTGETVSEKLQRAVMMYSYQQILIDSKNRAEENTIRGSKIPKLIYSIFARPRYVIFRTLHFVF